MDMIYRFLSRLRSLVGRDSKERELRDELAFHIELETEKNMRDGLSAEEARRRALVAFGGVEAWSESVRDERSFRWLDDVVSDGRYAIRGFRRSPGFVAVAVLTLGLGIGALTAIFTVVNSVLLRALPYPAAEELAVIYARKPEWNVSQRNISYPDYLSWKRDLRSFASLGIFNWSDYTISGDGTQAERVAGADVDADLFGVLGVSPLLGRGVLPEDTVDGRGAVVVLGHGLWQRRFGGDSGVLGRTIDIDGAAHSVIGVMPPRFQFPYSGEVWRPLVPNQRYASRGNRSLAGAVGRLRGGTTGATAEAELANLSVRLEQAYPETNTGWEGQYVPLRDDLVGELRPAMLIVLGAAALLLLIVCANIASLLLARVSSRAHELALRATLGAGRGRLVRQLLTEAAMLTSLGGVLALAVAYSGLGLLRVVLADRLPAFIHITPDLRVYVFAALATSIVVLITGVPPALQSARTGALAGVKDGGRTTFDRRSSRVRGALVVGEVAIAVALLIGSALLLRSMHTLSSIDPGFQSKDVLTARYTLPDSKYDSPERRTLFQAELFERLRALPHVVNAGAAQGTPFSGWNVNTSYEIEGETAVPIEPRSNAHVQRVTPQFFEMLDVPLVRGRMFLAADRPAAEPVALVNERFAALHFADRNPVGERVRLHCCFEEGSWLRIVGIVADYRHEALREPARPAVFLPYAQGPPPQMTLAIRTAARPADAIQGLRQVLLELDSDIPAWRVDMLGDVIARQTWVERIARDIVAAFAAAAALLAGIGLYGVVAHSVAQQRHEIGIRLALGIAPNRVLRLIVRRALALATIGIAIGWSMAFLSTDVLRQLLFEVAPVDVATFALVPLAVVGLAGLAALLPARRAAATDPAIVLRAE